MPRYLYRMLVFSLLLSAIPVISIGLISYYIASKDIEQKVNEGNVQILLQNQMRMEQILKNVEIGAVQYINSSLVSDGIYDNLQHDEFQTINNLSKGLYNLHSISGVADTRLINLEHRWMISNLGFTSSQEFANQDVLSQYASRKQNLFWLAETDNAVGGNKIRLVVKLPMIASSTVPKALLLIDISQDALLSNLEQNTQLGTIYVLNRDREPFLASSATNRVQPAILQRLQAAADPAGSFETDSMTVNYKVSSYNGWSYVSIVSIDAITKESKKIALITLNGCIIIFIIIAFAAFFGTRRMYRPIGRLFRMMEQVGGESQDSRKQDEFALIEERFSSLFSTRKQLQ